MSTLARGSVELERGLFGKATALNITMHRDKYNTLVRMAREIEDVYATFEPLNKTELEAMYGMVVYSTNDECAYQAYKHELACMSIKAHLNKAFSLLNLQWRL